MTVNANTLYWLFSTIAQTWGALLGVGGLLVVFKLEALRNARWSIIEDLSPLSGRVLRNTKPQAEDLLDEFEGVSGKSEGTYTLKSGQIFEILSHGNAFNLYDPSKRALAEGIPCPNLGLRVGELKHVYDSAGEIKKTFIDFLWLSLATIVSSVLLLIFCELLADVAWVWALPVFGVGVLIYLSLRSIIDLCRAIIQGEK